MLRKHHPHTKYYYVIITLIDGFEVTFNKWGTRHKMLINSNSLKHGVKTKKKLFIQNSHNKTKECETDFRILLKNKSFIESGKLEDIRINSEIKSNRGGCRIDIKGHFKFNTYDRAVKSRDFLALSLALALFEFLLLSHFIRQLDENDFLCDSQSSFFWTLNSAFSALFCLINVFLSVDHSSHLQYFLLLATLHFFNFSLILLRLLYSIFRSRLKHLISENPNPVIIIQDSPTGP